MAAVFDGTLRYNTIGPAGSITYPSAEWTVFLMFNPDVAASRNSQDYMYGHGQPSSSEDAVNITLNGTAGSGPVNTMRCRVESTASLKLLQNSVAVAVESTWNAFALVWDGTNFQYYLNGVQETFSPASSVGTLTPSKVARFGQRDDLSATRAYSGLMCHVTMFDRDLTPDEGKRYTDIFVSPDFAQQNKLWHVALWNSDFNFDQQNVQTVTPTSMLFGGPHAPAAYPTATATSLDEQDVIPAQNKRLMYVGA